MGSNQLFINVSPQVGIQRDGTDFDCTMYTEGSWVRFYKDRAKKIGGYQVLHPGTQEIVREMYSTNTAGAIILYLGRASSLTYLQVSLEGTTTSPIDRTPIGFTYDVNNQWIIWAYELWIVFKSQRNRDLLRNNHRRLWKHC